MMKKYNKDNERAKYQYLQFLREARRQSESSLDAAAKAIVRFEEYTGFRDFKLFHIKQAIGFKKMLSVQKSERSQLALSKSTINSTLNSLRAFFLWLAREPGYRARISYSDAEYFHLSEKDTRIATAKRNKPVPTLEQIKVVIAAMPSATDIEKRDRALLAFTILTGARDSAIASFKLKHVDISHRYVFQDAREVATKFSKTFNTYFFPVGDEIESIFRDWVGFLRKEMLWGEDDPVFPATKMELDENRLFCAGGLDRRHWSNAGPIRAMFKSAFKGAGLPYYNPHSFRNTLALLAGQRCMTPEQYKAWSQNLGHEKPLTTFLSYGNVEDVRQGEIIAELGAPKDQHDSEINMDRLATLLAGKLSQIRA